MAAEPSAALPQLAAAWAEAIREATTTKRQASDSLASRLAKARLERSRAKGHGSLSYVASKRIERVFEEWVDALLEEDKNAEETKE